VPDRATALIKSATYAAELNDFSVSRRAGPEAPLPLVEKGRHFAHGPAHPLLVMNVVFGMTVEDLSEQALAHLGYWDLRFPRFVYPGDTLISSSQVLDKRESGSRPDRGIVHVRTTGVNQRGEEVCIYERRILVKKRATYGGA